MFLLLYRCEEAEASSMLGYLWPVGFLWVHNFLLKIGPESKKRERLKVEHIREFWGIAGPFKLQNSEYEIYETLFILQ